MSSPVTHVGQSLPDTLCDCAFQAQKHNLEVVSKRTKAQPRLGYHGSHATEVAPREMGKEGG
jgi:hypothetical protein